MGIWLDEHEMRVLRAAMDTVIPGDGVSPGAGEAGGADYVDVLLGAFTFDPPRIFAGGPSSGRHGGEPGFERWLELSPTEELAWRIRIEGTAGDPAREFNGPSPGLQERYRAGLAGLGADFADAPPDERESRLSASADFASLVFEHACEALYGDPVYGGNHGAEAWRAIDFTGDVQPVGYPDGEVSDR